MGTIEVDDGSCKLMYYARRHDTGGHRGVCGSFQNS